jgi:hypothetical protein
MINHNLELLATQIQDVDRPAENTPGVGFVNNNNGMKLNLLTQFRWSMDIKLTRRMSLFVGPTFNVMFSRIVNPTTGEYELDILPRTLFEQNGTGAKPTYIAGWIGFNAGFRF